VVLLFKTQFFWLVESPPGQRFILSFFDDKEEEEKIN
jgi:hypothetical protein